jgi:hypothetical protein
MIKTRQVSSITAEGGFCVNWFNAIAWFLGDVNDVCVKYTSFKFYYSEEENKGMLLLLLEDGLMEIKKRNVHSSSNLEIIESLKTFTVYVFRSILYGKYIFLTSAKKGRRAIIYYSPIAVVLKY